MNIKLKKISITILSIIIGTNLLISNNIYAENIKTNKTLKDFLKISLEPVGKTMYVWGGGWNEEDTAAGIEAKTIGISPNWEKYFLKQNSNYNYKNTRYQIHDGLDCSGYVGWALYNLMPNEDGYVMKASKMARTFTEYGWGNLKLKGKFSDYEAGDILSSNSHVWISLGKCNDGSVVILHASPSGVMINGTQSGNKKSDAVKLSEEYMSKYYPEWHKKFPDYKRNNSYLKDYDRFRWDESFLKDPDNYRNMTPKEILADLFNENNKLADPKLIFKGESIEFDNRLVIKNGRTYYPFRELIEKINGEVKWINNTREAVGKYNNIEIKFKIDSNKYKIDNKEFNMDAKPFIENGKTYLPLRYVYEGFGYNVDWNNDNRTIIVE